MANTGYECGDGPGVYTRVSAFYEWIKNNEDAPTTPPTTTTSTTTSTSTAPSMSSIQIECISFALMMLILGILN